MLTSRREGGQEPVGRRPSGALEAEVMAALWAGPAPMTAAEVHAGLGPGLAYKTVLTVLGRLHAKGLLERDLVGRAHTYLPRRGPAESAAAAMSAALGQGPARQEILQRFVDTLDASEQAALRALLDDTDGDRR